MSKRYALAGLIVSAASLSAYGAGFQLTQHSVTGMGQAFAGTGVSGDDLGDLYANPAALTFYEPRAFQAGLILVPIENEFRNNGSYRSFATATGVARAPATGFDDTSETTGAVPNLYYVMSAHESLKFGLGLTSPFGQSSQYDNGWVGRFHALKSKLTTVDLNPSVAYDVNTALTVGAGISLQYADATLTNALFLGPGAPEGAVKVTGDDSSLGYNLGLVHRFGEATRFGISFRSAVEHELDGNRHITGTGRLDGRVGARATLKLPETVYLSGFRRITTRWNLLATVRWTNWSRNRELRVGFDDGAPDSVTPQQWTDSAMLSFGASYHHNDRWLFRLGIARDESPIPDATLRTPRNPDADRDWISVGFSYTKSVRTQIDGGIAVTRAGDRDVNVTTDLVSGAPGAVTDTLVGTYAAQTSVALGVQIRHDF